MQLVTANFIKYGAKCVILKICYKTISVQFYCLWFAQQRAIWPITCVSLSMMQQLAYKLEILAQTRLEPQSRYDLLLAKSIINACKYLALYVNKSLE